MRIIDDICCVGQLEDGIRVEEARLLRGKTPLVTFSTGEKRLFDASALAGSAFEPLSDEKALAGFTVFHGVMTWLDGETDIAPETMCTESLPYSGEAA